MSTRLSLKESGKSGVEIAEGIMSTPLLWYALLSTKDLDRGWNKTMCWTVDRKAAIARLEGAVEFISGLFPKLPIERCAENLLDRLRASKAKSLEVDVAESFATCEDEDDAEEEADSQFRPVIEAIETRNEDARLKRPGGKKTVKNPFTGESMELKSKPASMNSTRDLLLSVTSLGGLKPREVDDEMITGCIWP